MRETVIQRNNHVHGMGNKSFLQGRLENEDVIKSTSELPNNEITVMKLSTFKSVPNHYSIISKEMESKEGSNSVGQREGGALTSGRLNTIEMTN